MPPVYVPRQMIEEHCTSRYAGPFWGAVVLPTRDASADEVAIFGRFQFEFSTGHLRKDGTRLRVEDKPARLLALLLRRAGRVVTREELQNLLWPPGIHVDYDHGLNKSVNKLRFVLGDNPDSPTFIETLPRVGYRFIETVQIEGVQSVAVSAAQVAQAELLPAAPILSPPDSSTLEPKETASNSDVTSVGKIEIGRHWWISCGLAVGIFAVLGVWLLGNKTNPPNATHIRSVAVLPLRDLSPVSGQEYFADGITEELITSLAQSLPLRVISRTSVMRYGNTKESIKQIARELGVEAIVEGAVARSGNRVTVTVQLIDATQDRHLWAQSYDRSLGDLLGIEAELSREIANRVGATLTAQAAVTAAKTSPVDPQVYELCLLGRYHWNKRTAADLAKSAEYYQQATARDPNYAPAYAGLANAYALMPHYAGVGIQDNFTKGAAAARRALELDDTLAEAHATLGLIVVNTSDWKQAEAEFRRALELNPNYATAHHWYAFYLVFSGRESDALAEMELARQLDPLSVIINADQGRFLYGARHYEEAKVRLRQAIELAPDFGQPYATLAMIELETGHPSEALKEARTALALGPDAPSTMGEAGYVFGVTGHADEARKLLATLKDLLQRGSAFHSQIAMIQLGLGRRDEAFDTLEQMVNSKIGVGLLALNQSHAFDELKTDPRYHKLLSQQAAQR